MILNDDDSGSSVARVHDRRQVFSLKSDRFFKIICFWRHLPLSTGDKLHCHTIFPLTIVLTNRVKPITRNKDATY